MPAVSYVASAEAYLAFEAESDVKHEYFGPGAVVAMAGASPAHSLIAANTLAELRQRLRPRGCQTHGSDLRVRADWTYFYPDVVVVCEKPQYTEDAPPSLLNPTLVVEVTSPTTANRDRREKLEAYTRVESLQAYWIVEQDRPLVTQFTRRGDTWTVHFVRGLDSALRSDLLDTDIPLTDLYAQVELPPEPPSDS